MTDLSISDLNEETNHLGLTKTYPGILCVHDNHILHIRLNNFLPKEKENTYYYKLLIKSPFGNCCKKLRPSRQN